MHFGEMNRRGLMAGLLVLGAAPGIARAKGPSPSVTTANGRVQGAVAENGIASYRGVPYGAPTGGANRFMPPKPAAAWTGVREATAFGPTAPQRIPGAALPSAGSSVGSPPEGEDCLVLNVWTPEARKGAKRAVLVWLHGGGFTSGSASSPLYDGTNLARVGDVVVVSVNHRLNAFGYTQLGAIGGADFATSGNVGQLDIIQALAWVRDNIEAFGGDPGRVTIFGESGGGQKVTTLLAMPGAKGLIHGAIAESGPGIRMAKLEDQDRAARELMTELGLAAGDIRGLQAVAPGDLLKAYSIVNRRHPSRGPGFISVFAPTVDGKALPQHPFDPKAPPVSAHVPLIIGYNHTEATYFTRGREKYDMAEAEVAPAVKGLIGDDAEAITAAYRKALPGVSPWDLMTLISTDYPTAAFSREIARRKTAAGPAPAYLYRFDWETKVARMRAPHTIEMPFVFSNLDKSFIPLGTGDDQAPLAHKISTLWANFAKTGKPTAPGLPAWPAYDGKTRSTMLFSADSKVVADPDKALRVAVDGALGIGI